MKLESLPPLEANEDDAEDDAEAEGAKVLATLTWPVSLTVH